MNRFVDSPRLSSALWRIAIDTAASGTSSVSRHSEERRPLVTLARPYRAPSYEILMANKNTNPFVPRRVVPVVRRLAFGRATAKSPCLL